MGAELVKVEKVSLFMYFLVWWKNFSQKVSFEASFYCFYMTFKCAYILADISNTDQICTAL